MHLHLISFTSFHVRRLSAFFLYILSSISFNHFLSVFPLIISFYLSHFISPHILSPFPLTIFFRLFPFCLFPHHFLHILLYIFFNKHPFTHFHHISFISTSPFSSKNILSLISCSDILSPLPPHFCDALSPLSFNRSFFLPFISHFLHILLSLLFSSFPSYLVVCIQRRNSPIFTLFCMFVS